MADQEGYSPRNRAERVISAGRLFLAVLLAIAAILDPPRPTVYQPLLLVMTIGYLAYAAGLTILTWTRQVTTRAVPIVTHVIDLLIFAGFLLFTNGADSPFFPYLIFGTICGAIRWHGQGALITGAASLVLYMGTTLGSGLFLAAGDVHVGQFLARCTQLTLVAALLGYLGSYQFKLQREIGSLAAWPRRLSTQEPQALEEALRYAGTVLEAPRVVLVWEEGEEPGLRVAVRTGAGFDLSRARPDAFGVLVAETLQRSSFVCTIVGTRKPQVLQRVPGGFRFWNGQPLDAGFRQRFDVSSVVAIRLSTESIEGWLFALDRPRASADDLLLGDIVGRLVAGGLELQTLLEQLRESAAGDERVRLARELHDGVLQSLTAASLQAQRARQSIRNSPAEAERRLGMVVDTILSEQQALRLSIEDLKPGAIRETTPVDVIPRLREAATRVAQQWDIRVHLNLQRDVPPIQQKTAHELTRMLQEALVNAVRHGGASEATITCVQLAAELVLSVSYQGRGFAGFEGRHDLDSLNQMKVGPRTLKERVAAAGGSLIIESNESGARVEVRLPLQGA
ncbi:MAG: sensor histidine kinase [Acidobacteria bacterium]|nr:sensor histidine kinase [Acidobacteriota bacterium]